LGTGAPHLPSRTQGFPSKLLLISAARARDSRNNPAPMRRSLLPREDHGAGVGRRGSGNCTAYSVRLIRPDDADKGLIGTELLGAMAASQTVGIAAASGGLHAHRPRRPATSGQDHSARNWTIRTAYLARGSIQLGEVGGLVAGYPGAAAEVVRARNQTTAIVDRRRIGACPGNVNGTPRRPTSRRRMRQAGARAGARKNSGFSWLAPFLSFRRKSAFQSGARLA